MKSHVKGFIFDQLLSYSIHQIKNPRKLHLVYVQSNNNSVELFSAGLALLSGLIPDEIEEEEEEGG